MKEKLLLFVTGVLVGAIIATGAFCVYTATVSNKPNCPQMQQIPNNNSQQIQGGQNNNNNAQPPEMQNDNNSQNNNTLQNDSNQQQKQ